MIELILLSSWIIWLGYYLHLAWGKGTAYGPSYIKIFFPILIFFEECWPPGIEVKRMFLQIALLLIAILTAIEHWVGLVNAT